MRVNGLLHIALHVPPLDLAQRFYADFGLDATEQADTIAMRCAGRDQNHMLLAEGADKRLRHVAFGVEPGSLPDFQRLLEGRGAQIIDPPAGVSGGGTVVPWPRWRISQSL